MSLFRIRFTDDAFKSRGLGFLAGRFSFTSYETGETIVPKDALAALAAGEISFSVEGLATYADSVPGFRTLAVREDH